MCMCGFPVSILGKAYLCLSACLNTVWMCVSVVWLFIALKLGGVLWALLPPDSTAVPASRRKCSKPTLLFRNEIKQTLRLDLGVVYFHLVPFQSSLAIYFDKMTCSVNINESVLGTKNDHNWQEYSCKCVKSSNVYHDDAFHLTRVFFLFLQNAVYILTCYFWGDVDGANVRLPQNFASIRSPL